MPPTEVKILIRIDPKEDLAARCEVLGADGKKYATVRVAFERIEK